MTVFSSPKVGVHSRPSSHILMGFFSVFCLLLLLKNSTLAVEYMGRGLRLCAKVVVPSLFPFMILSEWIVSGGYGHTIFFRLASPLSRLLHLSPDGCLAMLLGYLCGFPVGAVAAIRAYERGGLSRAECEQVMASTGIPSSAFLITAVGASLWGNTRFGIVLWGCAVLSSLTVCAILGALRKVSDSEPRIKDSFEKQCSGARLLTTSVRRATESILLICAYVVFFSALMGTLSPVFDALSLPVFVRSMINTALELSGGVTMLASLSNTHWAAIMTAAGVGWSGLSVHCQLLSLSDGYGFSRRSYLPAKLLQTVLCALIFALFLHLFPSLLLPLNEC